MAILNIANKYNQDYLNYNDLSALIFTKDKHIVTHGVDFLSDYSNYTRGLIPDYNSDLGDVFFGQDGWTKIDTALSDTATSIPSSLAVLDYLNENYKNLILAAETMVFKGVLTYINNNFSYTPVNGSTISGFIQSANVGDVYRIGSSCKIANTQSEPGDMMICVKAYTKSDQNNYNTSEYWTIIQTNISGTKKVIIGGEEHFFYSNDLNDVTIYSPNNAGSKDLVLISTGGNVPEWSNLGLSLTDNKLSISKSSTGVDISNWTKTLTFGNGFITGSYNGTADKTLNLLAASTESLGGVKVTKVLNSAVNINTSPDNANTNFYYGLEIDNQGKAFVYVPQLQVEDTWRDILINAKSIGNKSLNITTVENGTISIITNESDSVVNMGFELVWYNLDNGSYEYE